jgi:tetratricopeptide (TPR) repeat protein
MIMRSSCRRRTSILARILPLFFLTIFLAPRIYADKETSRFTPGAKAIGLGYSGIVENYNVSALFWNPAGLTVSRAPQGYLSIHDPFTLNYLGYSHFVPKWGTFAASVSSHGQIAERMQCVTFGWAHELGSHFSIGFNINGMEQFGENAITAGLGALYRPVRSVRQAPRSFSQSPFIADRLTIGLAFYNIPLAEQQFEHQIRLGASYKVMRAGPTFVYARHFSAMDDTDHFGLLFHPAPFVHIYAGVLNFDTQHFSLGSGFQWDNVQVNVTYEAQSDRLILSTGFRIGAAPEDIADRYYDQAIEALRERDKKQALRLCEYSQIYDKNNRRAYNLEKRLIPFIQKENRQIDSLLTAAQSFENQGVFLSAAAQYLKVLKIDPQNEAARDAIAMIRPKVNIDVERWYQQAVDAFNTGNIERAQELFEAITLVRPDHFGSKNYLVKIESYYSKMAEQHYYAGLGYYSQRKLALAEAEFDKALDINPNLQEASDYISRIKSERVQNRRQIAALLSDAQRHEANQAWRPALEAYRDILKLQSDHSVALQKQRDLNERISAQAEWYVERGKTAYNNGESRRALELFNLALSLQPGHSTAQRYKNLISSSTSGRSRQLVERAQNAANQQDWQQTIVLADSALAIDPSLSRASALKNNAAEQLDVETVMQQAQAAHFAERHLDALELYMAVLEKEPEHAEAQKGLEECQTKLDAQVDKMYNRGIQLFTEDKYQEAINLLDTVLKINPYHTGAQDFRQKAQESLEILENLP